MRGFVASWFFPPVTSAEGIVTYKLLSNSSHDFDVVSANSEMWSYKQKSDLVSKNINNYVIETNNFDFWIDAAVKHFKINRSRYDYIMTRSMPPESHIVGLRIKKEFPDVLWIASFGDPIAKNPYELHGFIKDKYHEEYQKILRRPRLYIPLYGIIKRDKNLWKLTELMKFETKILMRADAYIFPSLYQMQYTFMGKMQKYTSKGFVIPHSFDKRFYKSNVTKNCFKDKIVFTYIGHSDNLRNPLCVIEALKFLFDLEPETAKKIIIRIVGNIPQYIKDKTFAFFLHRNVSFEKGVDFEQSIQIMQEADCLIHVDAFFDFMQNTIFFASKISDYLGTKKPILFLTTQNSEAYRILKDFTPFNALPWETTKIANFLYDVANGNFKIKTHGIEKYDARNVASTYDKMIELIMRKK